MGNHSRNPARAVLLPVNMGNRGQNCLPIQKTFEKLRRYSRDVKFIGYHWRQSGNFVFIDSGKPARKMALEAGKAVTGLTCLIRTFSDLQKVNQAVPRQAKTTSRGSVILPTPTGDKKLIHVALSQNINEPDRKTDKEIGNRVSVLEWPSPQDVLCVYDRPKQGGDVGEVTNRVLAVYRQTRPGIYGTGRALSVIRDLLENRNLRYE